MEINLYLIGKFIAKAILNKLYKHFNKVIKEFLYKINYLIKILLKYVTNIK
jgi:hypothetical protein